MTAQAALNTPTGKVAKRSGFEILHFSHFQQPGVVSVIFLREKRDDLGDPSGT